MLDPDIIDQEPDNLASPRRYILPFDTAIYSEVKPPCQALVHSFYSAGLHYHTLTAGGVAINVGKKQLQALMESGVFVWVRRAKPQSLPASPGMSIQIELSPARNLYAPEFNRPISDRSGLEIFGELAHRFSFKARKRVFKPLGEQQ